MKSVLLAGNGAYYPMALNGLPTASAIADSLDIARLPYSGNFRVAQKRRDKMDYAEEAIKSGICRCGHGLHYPYACGVWDDLPCGCACENGSMEPSLPPQSEAR